MVLRITSTGVSASGPMWNVAPALFTTPVSGPAAANSSSTPSGASRSVRTSVHSPPAASTSASASSAAASSCA